MRALWLCYIIPKTINTQIDSRQVYSHPKQIWVIFGANFGYGTRRIAPCKTCSNGKGYEGPFSKLVLLHLFSIHCYSDASVREILLKLDQSMHFIIEDLDSNHLFIEASQLDKVKAELERKLAENVYLPPDTLQRGYVEDATPELTADQCIGKVTELRGKVAVYAAYPLGSYLVLSPIETADSEQKVQWTIETLLRPDDVKQLRKDGEWPVIFDPPVDSAVAEDDESSDSCDRESASKSLLDNGNDSEDCPDNDFNLFDAHEEGKLLHQPHATRPAGFLLEQSEEYPICESAPPVPRRPLTSLERRPSWITQHDVLPMAEMERRNVVERQRLRDEVGIDATSTSESVRPFHPWSFISRLVTFPIPDIVLTTPFFGNLDQPSDRQVWREKTAFVLTLFSLCLCVVLGGYYIGFVACVPPLRISYAHSSLRHAILVNGRAYRGTANKADFDLIGEIANSEFPSDISRCPRGVPKTAYCGGRFNRQCRNLKFLHNYYIGTVAFPWEAVSNSSSLIVYGGAILDMESYLHRDKGFMGDDVNSFIRSHIGRDVSRSVQINEHMARNIDCLTALYQVGVVDMVSLPCALSYIILSGLLMIAGSLTAFKFFAAFHYYITFPAPSLLKNERYMLVHLSCQAASSAQIRNSLDSLTQTDYPDSKMVAVIVVGGENHSLVSQFQNWLGVCDLQRNLAETDLYASMRGNCQKTVVYHGRYKTRGHFLSSILIVTRGGFKDESLNLGSLDMLLGMLSSLSLGEKICDFEYSICRAFKQLTGQSIECCEYLLTLDARAQVTVDSLRNLANALNSRPEIMAACGGATLVNSSSSLVGRFQNYEYFRKQSYTFMYESAFGRSINLSLNFALYKLRKEEELILIHPAVIGSRNEGLADPITALLQQFPTMKTIHVPGAQSQITTTDGLHELLALHCHEMSARITVLKTHLSTAPSKILAFIDFMNIFLVPALGPLAIMTTLQIVFYTPLVTTWMLFFLVLVVGALPILLPWLINPMSGSVIDMLIYISALPVWTTVVPFYSFWHLRLDNVKRSSPVNVDCSSIALRLLSEHESINPGKTKCPRIPPLASKKGLHLGRGPPNITQNTASAWNFRRQAKSGI
ncbi:Fungal chitin synthase domain-containing protein [Paramicrosporidium saccamoebae]|uniref:RNA polymerase II transcription factor B subunit 5 n=1 Tax=Paramicrosporidium saccamoebae TaxID=1246581 RepID=A0A2H9TPC0_9FUNG|nr:Fungal chitin synthase domain-containing protein [Paramicrosporidium saccamoebae]